MKDIQFEHGIPLYLQIIRYIREMIETGELKIGNRLPSEETLCKKFQVSKITVIRALRELKNEGLIVRKQGRGSFVKEPDYSENLNISANFRSIKTVTKGKAEHKLLKWHIIKPPQEVRKHMQLRGISFAILTLDAMPRGSNGFMFELAVEGVILITSRDNFTISYGAIRSALITLRLFQNNSIDLL